MCSSGMVFGRRRTSLTRARLSALLTARHSDSLLQKHVHTSTHIGTRWSLENAAGNTESHVRKTVGLPVLCPVVISKM